MNRLEIEGLTADMMVDRITAAVVARLAPMIDRPAEPAPATEDRLLVNARDLSRILSTSESTIARLVAAGLIPSVPIGTSRRFNPEAVINALSAGSPHRPSDAVQSEGASDE